MDGRAGAELLAGGRPATTEAVETVEETDTDKGTAAAASLLDCTDAAAELIDADDAEEEATGVAIDDAFAFDAGKTMGEASAGAASVGARSSVTFCRLVSSCEQVLHTTSTHIQ